MNPNERIMVALDVSTQGEAMRMVDALGAEATFYKVGLQLFCAEGAAVVRALKQRGKRVFLDLKFHDIPNTVAGAVRSVASLGVDMLTVHASGGRSMMEAAVQEAARAEHPPVVLGVTVLTSMDPQGLREVNVAFTPADQVVRLSELAREAGCSGLVCSPEEVARVRAAAPSLTLVIPGIRPAGMSAGDQSRVATPVQAVASGADYLVIGRPITTAANPKAAFKSVVQELTQANYSSRL